VSVASPGWFGLAEVARSHPEWRAWLAVLEVVAEAAGDRAWRLAVPDAPTRADIATPLLTGATLTPGARLVRRWGRRLLETAARAGGAAAALSELARADDDTLTELLELGLAHDTARVSALAVELGVEPQALAAVAAVAPVPLLRACSERWRKHVPPAWSHGYCPVCGAWPALAEACGLERARRLRCGRCAADWGIAWLRCGNCGMEDHTQLGGLVADRSASTARTTADPAWRTTIETCLACRGYLKTLTTLGPTAGDDLGLLDLATVELDMAALAQGYVRPTGLGVALGARVQPRTTGILGGWRR
jgi:FdhE protein